MVCKYVSGSYIYDVEDSFATSEDIEYGIVYIIRFIAINKLLFNKLFSDTFHAQRIVDADLFEILEQYKIIGTDYEKFYTLHTLRGIIMDQTNRLKIIVPKTNNNRIYTLKYFTSYINCRFPNGTVILYSNPLKQSFTV
jgi:hypothetical protein